MKRILFAFALIMLTSGIMSAQEKAAVISVVDNAVFDFGDIKEADGPVTHVFKIKNEGEAPLVITNATAACGCTTPDWTKQPIAPGKTGEIKVTYNPAQRPGPFTKPISVYSNGKTGTYILTIKGKVIPKE
jgi:archaellum component FlaG (FlaF/FlaG flagellin family)